MDYSTNRSVPFEIPNVNHGFQVAKGILKLRSDGIELEFETKDAILGVISSGVQSVQLSYSELESIRFDKGWFSAKIILEAISMRVLEDIPGTEQATCMLKVNRKHKDEAQKVISTARMQLSEHKLDRMDGGGEDEY
jgi:hypothetical protein